jgi:hypothetical protein
VLSYLPKINNSPQCWRLMSAAALIAQSTRPGKVLGRRENSCPSMDMIAEVSQT